MPAVPGNQGMDTGKGEGKKGSHRSSVSNVNKWQRRVMEHIREGGGSEYGTWDAL